MAMCEKLRVHTLPQMGRNRPNQFGIDGLDALERIGQPRLAHPVGKASQYKIPYLLLPIYDRYISIMPAIVKQRLRKIGDGIAQIAHS